MNPLIISVDNFTWTQTGHHNGEVASLYVRDGMMAHKESVEKVIEHLDSFNYMTTLYE